MSVLVTVARGPYAALHDYIDRNNWGISRVEDSRVKMTGPRAADPDESLRAEEAAPWVDGAALPLYRQRPLIVVARQWIPDVAGWSGGSDHPVISWLVLHGMAWSVQYPSGELTFHSSHRDTFVARPGDWIVLVGEHFTVHDPSRFEALYEAVEAN